MNCSKCGKLQKSQTSRRAIRQNPDFAGSPWLLANKSLPLVHLSYPCGIQILVQMSPVRGYNAGRDRSVPKSVLQTPASFACLLCVQATPRALRKQPAARRLSESCCQLVPLHFATLMTGAQDEPIVARMDGPSTKMSLLRTQHGDREITLWRLRAISHHVSGSATAD